MVPAQGRHLRRRCQLFLRNLPLDGHWPVRIFPAPLGILFSTVTNTHSVVACAIYYWVWVYWVPVLRGYRLRQEIIVLENGAQTNNLIKVPVDDLATWDAEHDKVGRRINEVAPNGNNKGTATAFGKEEVGVITERATFTGV